MSAGFPIIRTQSISDAWSRCSATTSGMQELNLQYSSYNFEEKYYIATAETHIEDTTMYPSGR